MVVASGTEELLGKRYRFIAKITTAGISLYNKSGEFVQVSYFRLVYYNSDVQKSKHQELIANRQLILVLHLRR